MITWAERIGCGTNLQGDILLRFSLKEISDLFDVTRQNVMAILGDYPSIYEARLNLEGARSVVRKVKTYDMPAIYMVAVRSRKIWIYHNLCEANAIEKIDLVVKRKEANFYDLLCAFIPDVEIVSQHRVKNFIIDFLIPDYSIAVEYDEKHHLRTGNQQKDAARQKEIELLFGYKFVRIEEGNEIRGLYLVAEAIFSVAKPCSSNLHFVQIGRWQ